MFNTIINELEQFRLNVGLPKPSTRIFSGGGLHAYWLLDRVIDNDHWTDLSQLLRACVEQCGLHADIGCTTDSARVLRVPGTLNRKPEYQEPREVEVVSPADGHPPVLYKLDELKAALARVRPQTPQAKARSHNALPFPLFPRRPPIEEPSNLSAGIESNLEEIRSAMDAIPPSALASEGDWMRIARALAHTARIFSSQSEDLWTIFDARCAQAPNYNAVDNRTRWERYISEVHNRENPITIGTLFHLAKSFGWQGWSPRPGNLTGNATGGAAVEGTLADSLAAEGTSPQDTSAAPEQADNIVYFFPGNEPACRDALDRIVAADELVFTLDGGPLVTLRVPNERALPAHAHWDGDLPATTLATPADIMQRAEKLSWTYRSGGRGGERWKRGSPPRQFIADYLVQMRNRYSARVLTGISRMPRIDDNGDVHFVAGYDEQTGLYHDQTPAFTVPAAPTREDALEAVRELLGPFQHYVFENHLAGQALLLGMILTAIERPSLPTAPMFVVRASMPGVGKGLLVRAVTKLAFNSLPVIATWGHSDEEFSKRLDALLLQSPAAVSIDNANGKLLRGDSLEAILSEGVADVRPLGRSETIRVRNRSFLTATGNNLVVTGDMARRALVLDVQPKSASPERDIYPFNPADFVHKHRTALLQAAFTIMRAYRLAKPSQSLPGVGSFDEWARRVRDLVAWLLAYDLSEAFQQNKEEDPRRQEDAALLAALHDIYGASELKSGDVHTIYTTVANHKRIPINPKPTLAQEALHAAIENAIGSKDITAKRIGQWAGRVDGAFIEGFKLDVRRDRRSNTNVITVQRI